MIPVILSELNLLNCNLDWETDFLQLKAFENLMTCQIFNWPSFNLCLFNNIAMLNNIIVDNLVTYSG